MTDSGPYTGSGHLDYTSMGSGQLTPEMLERPCADELSSLVQSVRDHAATMRKLADVEAQRDAALARLADVWDEAAEATADWMANNPSPSGIPHDPPRNPYEDEWTADPEGGA